MARKSKSVTLDTSGSQVGKGGTSGKFTVAWLMSHGATKASAQAAVRKYNAYPTTGLKASYRKDINAQLGIAPSKAEIAAKASKSKASKAGNGKGSSKRSAAARKAAATRKANAQKAEQSS